MTAEQFLLDKGILQEGNKDFIIRFHDDNREVSVNNLLVEFAALKLEESLSENLKTFEDKHKTQLVFTGTSFPDERGQVTFYKEKFRNDFPIQKITTFLLNAKNLDYSTIALSVLLPENPQ